MEPSRPGEPWNASTAYTQTSVPCTRHCGLLSKLPQILNLQDNRNGRYPMTLQQKLDDFKAQFESGGPPYNAPKAVIEIFHRATEELRQSGLSERALKTGDRAPAFTLNNQDGNPISSEELLAKGPLVITFFRGHW